MPSIEAMFWQLVERVYRAPWWFWVIAFIALIQLYIYLNPGCCGPGPYSDMAPVYHQ